MLARVIRLYYKLFPPGWLLASEKENSYLARVDNELRENEDRIKIDRE